MNNNKSFIEIEGLKIGSKFTPVIISEIELIIMDLLKLLRKW